MLEHIKKIINEYERINNVKVKKFRLDKQSQFMVPSVLIEVVTDNGTIKIDSGILFENIISSQEYHDLLNKDFIEY